MMTMMAFIKRHPLAAYFALAFAISWSGALVVLGPGAFLGSTEISLVEVSPFAYLPFLAGPSLAGILLAGLVHGRAGLRDVRSRLLRWRVGVRWYVIALLTAPFVTMATQFPLSLTSPVFLPGIITVSDKTSLLMSGITVGLVVSFFEELGWTGFAIPELRKRHGILATGLIVGLLWGAWHFPLFSGSASSSGAIPPALYVAVLLFSWLPPYRVLMVWVYDRTGSLLVAMLMHVPIVIGQFVLRPTEISGAAHVTSLLVYAAALWAVVGAVAVANRGQISRQQLQTRVARTSSPFSSS
jgi:membrane protease YdiL (CAAX protease family)